MVAWWLLTAAIGFGLMAGVSGISGRGAKVAACLFALSLSLSVALSKDNEALSWAPIRRESRPWTYWWWLGSAVTKEEITRHMELFKQAGLGGVHIIPIYGAQGCEDRYKVTRTDTSLTSATDGWKCLPTLWKKGKGSGVSGHFMPSFKSCTE